MRENLRQELGQTCGKLSGVKGACAMIFSAHGNETKKDYDCRLFRACDDRPTSENFEAHIGSCGSNDSTSGRKICSVEAKEIA